MNTLVIVKQQQQQQKAFSLEFRKKTTVNYCKVPHVLVGTPPPPQLARLQASKVCSVNYYVQGIIFKQSGKRPGN